MNQPSARVREVSRAAQGAQRVRRGDPSAGVLARIGAARPAKRKAKRGHATQATPKHTAKRRRAPAAKPDRIAAMVDRHRLYEHSVQSVDVEIDFVDETFRTLRGRRAVTLREDFCGTANTACEWVRRRSTNRAIGVDLDPEVQGWGLKHKVGRLKPAQRKRIQLVNADVMTVKTPPTDIVLAMNFSYWLWDTRESLRAYFRSVREHLTRDGVLFLDGYGGYEASKEMRERRTIKARGPWGKSFTYIWDQASFEPISAHMQCYIHFAFEDGSRLNRAFSYAWRLWTLPELREILLEAGFSRATVYWEGTDEKTGEGNGEYAPAERGEADAAFIVYIVAEK